MKKLHDTTIAHIAKILQVALLTGTDIIDNLRLVTLEEKEGVLFLDSEYEKHHNESINEMLEKVNNDQRKKID